MKTYLKKLLTCVLGAVAAICFTLSITTLLVDNNNVYAVVENASLVGVESGYTLDTRYDANVTLAVPSVDIQGSDGQTVTADKNNAILIYPDGIARKAISHKLSQYGDYELVYTQGNLVYTHEFEVARMNWSVSSNFSTAEYVDKLQWSNLGKSGIRMNLADGDVFTYNVPINVNDFNGKFDVFRIYPEIATYNNYANSNGGYTVHAVYATVRLVDCYDADNYVEFYLWATGSGGYYLGAGWSGHSPTGLEFRAAPVSGSEGVTYDGAYYNCHRVTRWAEKAQYGASSACSNFRRLNEYGGFIMQYDPTNQVVYRPFISLNSNGYESEARSTIVTDLDSPLLYTAFKEKLFSGFTTGDVYFQIKCEQYKSPSVVIEIENMMGVEGADLAYSAYSEELAPTVKLDVNKTDDAGIRIPKNVEFTLPGASVYDVNYNGDLSTKVYYNYGTAQQTAVRSNNGKFTPDRLGTYTVVYTATDTFGNKGIETLSLNVVEDKAITYAKAQKEVLYAGETNVLPAQNATNINGPLSCQVYAISPLGETITVNQNSDGDYAFEPEVVGNYEIKYVFTDNVFTEVWSYTVACNDNNNNIRFYDQISLPAAFIKDANYTIEDYFAYTMSENGRVAHLTQALVSLDGAAFTPVADSARACYQITASNSVQFKYEYSQDGVTNSITSQVIPVIQANYQGVLSTPSAMTGYTQYAKYFMGNQTMAMSNNILAMHFDGTNATETVTYANVLSYSEFKLNFNLTKLPTSLTDTTQVTNGNFTSFTITLTDFYNSANKVEITYAQVGKNVEYTANGVTTVFKEVDLINIANNIEFNKYTGEIENSNGISVPYPKFTGDYCIFSLTVDGITGPASFGIKQLANQTINKRTKLNSSTPMFSFETVSGGKPQGSSYTVSALQASSVLLPLTADKFTVSVKDPNENYIKDVNGVTLSGAPADKAYEIVLNTAGQYVVEYSVEMPYGAVKTANYTINCTDAYAPTLAFENGINQNTLIKLKVGNVHAIKDFTISDNLSSTSNGTLIWSVQIKDEAGFVVKLLTQTDKNTNKFGYIFLEEGLYKVSLIAYDAEGNVSSTYYYVLAE